MSLNDSIDFIIVNYKTFDFVKLLVQSIDIFVNFDKKIYINDSSNEYCLLKQEFKTRNDIFIFNKKFSRNFSSDAVSNHIGGINYLFDQSSSKYVCILDPDTVFVDNWIDSVLPFLRDYVFVSNRFEYDLQIARPQFMFFKRDFWLKNKLHFDEFKDTGGNITEFCRKNNLQFFILDNSYNNKEKKTQHVLPEIYCEQSFVNNLPFFLHQGRGGSKGDRSVWFSTVENFLNSFIEKDFLTSKIKFILENSRHKSDFKSTTSLKFKKDVTRFLLNEVLLQGNILEIGTNRGYTTVVLAAIAEEMGFKVISFDNDSSMINYARNLCASFSLKNCELIQKNVYRESWNMREKFHVVFIDAIHEASCFYADLINAEKVLMPNGFIIVHDYGLQNNHGRPIYDVLKENKEKYRIVKYVGEHANWNNLGSGIAFDFEGAIIKINR